MILDYTVMISKEFKYVNTVEKKEAYDIINTVMIMRWLEICEHNWKKKEALWWLWNMWTQFLTTLRSNKCNNESKYGHTNH